MYLIEVLTMNELNINNNYDYVADSISTLSVEFVSPREK